MSIAEIIADSIAEAQPLAAEVSEGNMVSRIEVTRQDQQTRTLDYGTGRVVRPPPTSVYVGPAALSRTTGPITFGVGEEQQYFESLTATVPLSAPRIRVNDDVKVLVHPDADLQGRYFRVQDVTSGGTLPASRQLQLIGAQPSENQ